MSLLRSTMTIGGYTLISRVFGFIRDMMIASMLGAGVLSDAFFVAFKLPNFMRRLFAEGAFNSAFVPLFAGILTAEGPEKAKRFASEAYSVLLLVLVILTILAEIFMPNLMVILAPGFYQDPYKYELTILLTRITFPYIIFISLVSLQGGILNSFDKFGAVAATPILMNLSAIIAMLALSPFTPTTAHALAIGVMVSGVIQYAWLAYFCRKENMFLPLVRPRMTDNVRKLLKLIAPAALGAGVAQVNLMIDVIIGSTLPDAVSYLYYADRISELPLAVIGIAVGTALLPMLSRQIREGNQTAAYHSQNRATELVLFLSLPAAAALIALAEPIIRVIYEHGEFTTSDTSATSATLVAYAIGLPSFVLVKVLAPGFFANHDTKTPFIIATICVLINLTLNLTLIGPMQQVGLALSTTVAGWVNAGAMAVILYRRNIIRPDAQLISRLPRMIICSLLMTGLLYFLMLEIQPWLKGTLLWQIIGVGILVSVGMGSYFGSAFLTRAMDTQKLKEYLTRKRG